MRPSASGCRWSCGGGSDAGGEGAVRSVRRRSGADPEVGLDEPEFEGAAGGEMEVVGAQQRIGRGHATGADAGDGAEEGIHRGVDRAGAMTAPAAGRY